MSSVVKVYVMRGEAHTQRPRFDSGSCHCRMFSYFTQSYLSVAYCNVFGKCLGKFLLVIRPVFVDTVSIYFFFVSSSKLANQLHIKYVFLHERLCVEVMVTYESSIVYRTIAVKPSETINQRFSGSIPGCAK